MIKFPTMHIAQSVTNRILNVAEELKANGGKDGTAGAGLQVSPAPAVPEPGPLGEAVEMGLAQDAPAVPGVDDPSADPAAAFGSIVKGGSALQGLINRRTGQ